MRFVIVTGMSGSGKSSVTPADPGVLDVIRIRNEFANKKLNHTEPP